MEPATARRIDLDSIVAASTWLPDMVAVSGTGETVRRNLRTGLTARIRRMVVTRLLRMKPYSWFTNSWAPASNVPATVPGHMGYS